MPVEFATALPFILIGLVLLLLVIWLVSRSNRKTSVIDDETTGPKTDELDEGSGKPKRNQALIDAPKATEIVYGTTSANANADEIAMAGEAADSEAGVSVAPTVGDPSPPRRGQDAAPGEQAAPAHPQEQGRAGSEPRTGGEAATRREAPHPEARKDERTRPSPPAPPAKPATSSLSQSGPSQSGPSQSGDDTVATPSPGATAPPPPPAAAAPDPARANAKPQGAAQDGDDLTRIKGLGPKLATILREQGVTRFDQIANWSEDDIDRVDANLGRFKGRIRRDQWVEQARLLQTGDQAAFENRFGNTV